MDEHTKRKFNIRLYPIYKMFSWDILFYYAISFIFVNQVKGLSAATILFIDAFYPIFKIVFGIFCITIIDHIGKRKGLILGNASIAASTLALITFSGVTAYVLCAILMAFGFVLKELAEDTFLSNSIPESDHKPNIFSKVDGNGCTLFYYLDAISSIATGFLFVINAYLPMIISLMFSIVSILISLKFKDVKSKTITKVSSEQNLVHYFKDLKHIFKFIFQSGRLKSLLMFSALMASFAGEFSTFRSALLLHLNFPTKYFGIVVAVGQLISALSTRQQVSFREKFKNRTLAWLSLPVVFSLILMSSAIICNLDIVIVSILVVIFLAVFYITKGPYNTLIKRYYNNFSSSEINTKIYTAKSLIESLVRSIFLFFAAFLLRITDISYALLIIGLVLAILFLLLLDYMRTRVGLKPEEYRKKDIEFHLLK